MTIANHEIAGPAEASGTSPEVGPGAIRWRSWLLVPEGEGNNTRPLLTGLLGQPWPGPEIEARCVANDPAAALSGNRGSGRYHRVVPDPDCTCGIYAAVEPLSGPPPWLPIPRHPVVSGFVELSGRILLSRNGYRARAARIIGPLALGLPRTAAFRVKGVPPRTVRVIAGRDGYRLSAIGRRGVPVAQWRSEMARQLSARYRVPVVPADSTGSRYAF